MMKVAKFYSFFLLVSANLLVCSALHIDQLSTNSAIRGEWNAWKSTYQKAYESRKEEQQRFSIWLYNRDKINRHNRKFDAGLLSYSLKLNQFGDESEQEFSMRRKSNKAKQPKEQNFNRVSLNVQQLERKLEGRNLPSSVDWRTSGVVNNIKDQGVCGSCYAFATVCTVESHYAIKTGHLLSLSEQQVVDCAVDEGDEACDGGLPDFTYDYILIRGLTTGKDYPYKDEAGKCMDDHYKPAVHIHSYVDLPSEDEYAMKLSVALIGPVAVGIDAENAFRFYDGGVFNSTICDEDPATLDHAVVVVGYGTDSVSGENYWLVRNSWGTSWGEGGYIRYARTKPYNLCGITDSASFPLV